MGKKKNEVNGVLVYRRWCAGAILSALILLLVIATPVLAVIYNWMIINVPDGSTVSAAGKFTLSGLDLIKPVLNKPLEIQDLINDIAASTSVKYFALLMRIFIYVMFGFLALVTLFGVIEAIFFLFYLLSGRVVNPAVPVKLSWVIFTMSLIFAGLTFGLSAFISSAYASAEGGTFNFLQFLVAGILPTVPEGIFVVNFFWPLAYAGVALISAIILSIIYVVAFKDKFFIGRAKRFGSGEVTNTERYETTRIITTNGTTTTTNPVGAQPSVIVVNTTPAPAASAPIIAALPGQAGQQPIIIQGQQPVQQVPAGQNPEEVPAPPVISLPANVKSIGGHAYSKNLDLKYADIPDGIKELGVGAFANCLNLEVVSIPRSVKRIKKNCFFNCVKLTRINYAGTKSEWRYIVRGSNWLDRAGTKTIICSDGAIIVDPHR